MYIGKDNKAIFTSMDARWLKKAQPNGVAKINTKPQNNV